MTGPPPLPPLEVNLELQTEMKQASQNRFFWIFYFVYGLLILAYVSWWCYVSLVRKIDVPYIQLALSILWFLPVVLLKFRRRFATVLALIPVAILWAYFFFLSAYRVYWVCADDGTGPSWTDSPVLFLGLWAMEIVFMSTPLSILLIAGSYTTIRYFKNAKACHGK